MSLEIDVFACLSDNYGFLMRDSASGLVACVDTPEPAKIEARVQELGWNRIDYIFNTHKHWDHADGNAAVKARWGCQIIGPAEIAPKNPIDQIISPGETFALGETRFEIMDLSGHTLGLIGWYDPAGGHVFVGDCLFPLGCGRMFEGTPEMFWASLKRLCDLPHSTVIYSAHEYTLANLRFAESVGLHAALIQRGEKLRNLRAKELPTVPSTVGEEKAANPFLYYPLKERDFAAQARCFGQLRAAKDSYA